MCILRDHASVLTCMGGNEPLKSVQNRTGSGFVSESSSRHKRKLIVWQVDKGVEARKCGKGVSCLAPARTAACAQQWHLPTVAVAGTAASRCSTCAVLPASSLPSRSVVRGRPRFTRASFHHTARRSRHPRTRVVKSDQNFATAGALIMLLPL